MHLATSANAMLVIIFLCLFSISITLAIPFQHFTSRQPKSTVLPSNIPNVTGLNVFRCFDPTFSPPGGLYPVRYSACTNAADRMLSDVRRNVPLTFSRNEDADIQLPWRMRSENCLMTLDVLNEDDEDIMCIQDAHEIALALCKICSGGYYRYGGTTPVGPRGVLYVSVYGTEPVTVEATGSAAPQPSHIISRDIKPELGMSSSGLFNASLIDPAGLFNLNTSNLDIIECFTKPSSSSSNSLHSSKSFFDCLNAADEMLKDRPVHVDMTFGRKFGSGFRLPWSARSESCIVNIDTLDDGEFDTLTVWKVYQTATDFIREKISNGNGFCGHKAVGPRDIVYVYIFALRMPSPDISPSARLVA